MAKYTVTIINEETGKSSVFTGLDMVLFDGITAKDMPDGKKIHVGNNVVIRGGGDFLGPMLIKFPEYAGDLVANMMEMVSEQGCMSRTYGAYLLQEVIKELKKHEEKLIMEIGYEDIGKILRKAAEKFSGILSDEAVRKMMDDNK